MTSTGHAIVGGALVATATLAIARLLARMRTKRVSSRGDVVPAAARDQAELVDSAIDGSFPASDPPSYWGRDADDTAS